MGSDRLQRVKSVEVPIVVRLGSRQMKLRDVLTMIPGSILELPKAADEYLDLLVANKQIGAGEAVKVGENFGIRIRHIGDVRERIEALRPKRPASAAEPAAASPEDEAAALAEAMLSDQV